METQNTEAQSTQRQFLVLLPTLFEVADYAPQRLQVSWLASRFGLRGVRARLTAEHAFARRSAR